MSLVSDGGSCAFASQAVPRQRRPPGPTSLCIHTSFRSPCQLGTCALSCEAPATGAGAALLPGGAAQHACLWPSALPSASAWMCTCLWPSTEARWGTAVHLPACGPSAFADSQCDTAYQCVGVSANEARWDSDVRLPACGSSTFAVGQDWYLPAPPEFVFHKIRIPKTLDPIPDWGPRRPFRCHAASLLRAQRAALRRLPPDAWPTAPAAAPGAPADSPADAAPWLGCLQRPAAWPAHHPDSPAAAGSCRCLLGAHAPQQLAAGSCCCTAPEPESGAAGGPRL